ncbi:MAG: DUF2399 domain-containing protein [Deltaproteobacteria bacterium]|nr:DUF2399 domain-containing protein [Deltaproteobacteria bacterium]
MTDPRRRIITDGPKKQWLRSAGGVTPEGCTRLLRKGRGKTNRWRSAGRAAGAGVDQVEAERLLWSALDAGLVTIHERRNRRGDFEPYEWILTEAGEQHIIDEPKDVDVDSYLAVDDDGDHPVLASIRSRLERGVDERGSNLVRLVIAIGEEIRAGRIPRGRMIAVKVGGHTKSIRVKDYEEELREALGFPADQIVRPLGQSALVYGPLSFSINGRRIDCEWSVPWLALTTPTIEAMHDIELRGERLLTVENLAAFEEAVCRGLPPRTVAVYTGGFPGRLERAILLRLISAGAKSMDHWGDLDFDGLRILRHLDKIMPISVRPFRMEPELLTQLATRPLEDRERLGLEAWLADQDAPCRQLAAEMLRLDCKAEQESWFLVNHKEQSKNAG